MGIQFASVIFEKGFDNVYMLTGGIEEFYQSHPECCEGPQPPPLLSELSKTSSPDKAKEVVAKPRIRKTKDELIDEHDKMLEMKGMPNKLPTLTKNGFNKTSSTSKTGKYGLGTKDKFDDIPDNQSVAHSKKSTAVKKTIKQPLQKEEREVTDKLTNIKVDGDKMTSVNVARVIDKFHKEEKEVTQKPNFNRFTPDAFDK